MSKIYATSEALVANPPQADVYITGSDQVWNYSLIPGEIKTFFLQFGNEKAVRVAYAASIGHSDFSEEIKTTIKTYLSSFSSISVRESSAVNVLKNMGFEATPVLDPTMLLTAKDYQKFLGNNSNRKHIFIYSMNYETINDIPFDEIKKYAQDKDLPIIVTPGDGFVSARELFEGVEYCYATIPQWIQLIANAQLVVTASFHGIVFSILMHTPFVYTPLRGEYAESNNRVLDLLKNLDLEQQIYTKQFNPHINIEWDCVDEKLDLLRQRSSEYLLNSIKK